MKVQVFTSTVADGSQYNPEDASDETVIRNRLALFERLGLNIEDASRVHISYFEGDETFLEYRSIDASAKGVGMTGDAPRADALVTTTPGHALFLPIADCVATTFFDEEHGVLMLSHLGRHSLEVQGGKKSVEYLVERYGSNPERIKVWLGPAPNKEVYPIFKLNGQGMKEAVLEQLETAGITPDNITDNPADTATDPNYYSHSEFLKGNKPTDGRFAMIAVMQA
jgi:copper oxidase (laccase) domain-containing protein